MNKYLRYLCLAVCTLLLAITAKEKVIYANDINEREYDEKYDEKYDEVDSISASVSERQARNIIEHTLGKQIDGSSSAFWNEIAQQKSYGISVMAIEVNEVKKITWESAKFETGLPGYKWYWSLDVTVRANSEGTGYEYVESYYTIHTVVNYIQIFFMQYETYHCKLADYNCIVTIYDNEACYDLWVEYDITYMLQGQMFPTMLSVRGSDSHTVLLK